MIKIRIQIVNYMSGVGKDTFVELFVKELKAKGKNLETLKLSKPGYQIAEKYFGMVQKERNLIKPILEKLREIDPDVWVNYAISKVEADGHYIVTDVRQENEIINFMNADFFPILIVAKDEIINKRRIARDGEVLNQEFFNLPSESGALVYLKQNNIPFFELDNSGTVEELREKVKDIVEAIVAYEDAQLFGVKTINSTKTKEEFLKKYEEFHKENIFLGGQILLKS